jgi:hypothetical protein
MFTGTRHWTLSQMKPVHIILLIFIVYLTTLSVSHYIASNERIIVNNELERMWKEAVMA